MSKPHTIELNWKFFCSYITTYHLHPYNIFSVHIHASLGKGELELAYESLTGHSAMAEGEGLLTLTAKLYIYLHTVI